MAFIDKVYNNTAVSFFHSGSPRGGLKLVCRPQSLVVHPASRLRLSLSSAVEGSCLSAWE
jgi:hypothetical protein